MCRPYRFFNSYTTSFFSPHTLPHSRLGTVGTRLAHQAASPFLNTTKSSSPQPKFCRLPSPSPTQSPLSLLPFDALIRSYLLAVLSSSPFLLNLTLRLLSRLARSRSLFWNVDRNHVLHYLVKKTFYAHFCAGETPREVEKTVSRLKEIGFQGVILVYSKEIELKQGEDASVNDGIDHSQNAEHDVENWKNGNLATVRLANRGDFVAIKLTGAGSDVVRQLAAASPPNKLIYNAIAEICKCATARGVRLLFDAEHSYTQNGIDSWTLQIQEQYNRNVKGEAMVYGTYQAYLRSTPKTVANHLAVAKNKGFVLGLKLVRGAYMGSDPRHLFWSTKEATDRSFDGITEALLQKKCNGVLTMADNLGKSDFPKVSLILATHNHASVRKAMEIRKEQANNNKPLIETAYGQLMGMADDLSCELVMAKNKYRGPEPSPQLENKGPNVYKYLPWGTVHECLSYLVRRAEENRNVMEKAKEGRLALKTELRRRVIHAVM